jgi:rubrerythrin
MATWKCGQCGHEKEGRCKPRKCPQCTAADSFAKKAE